MINTNEKLAMAAKHQSAGRLPQAVRIYQEILDEDPAQPDALHLLGIIALQQGRGDDALELVGRAGTLRPDDPGILNSLGLTYRQAGKLAEAGVCYRRALTLDPAAASTHANMGELLLQEGKPKVAEQAFEAALELEPHSSKALFNLAGLLHRRGELTRALELYRLAEAGSPDDWQIKSNMALLLKASGELEQAEDALRRALLLDPANPLLSLNLASVLLARGDDAHAEKLCREVVTLTPDNAAAHNNLGLALLRQGRQAEAVLALLKSLSLNKSNPQAQVNMGDAMRLDSKYDQALACYERALALEPRQPEAVYKRATVLLQLGRYEEGFAGYAARRALPGAASRQPRIPAPRWDGADLADETVLLHGDGPLSETILLLRYLPLVREAGGRVILACPPELARLAVASGLADELLLPGEPAPAYHKHAALDDLPRLLGGDPADLSALPYLRCPPELQTRWARFLASDGPLTVGMLWKGDGAPRDLTATIPLEAWRETWDLPDTRWASLQYGIREDELRQIAKEPRVADLAGEVKDLADALGALSALDLLITADTAVAHLAGAAGVDALVLLSGGPAWCWGAAGEHTPWYPTLRLLRRDTSGEWGAVMDSAREELVRRLKTQTT